MDGAEQMLREMEGRIEDQLRQAEQLKAQVAATDVTVESTGGEAIVTVDSAGSLVALRLTEPAMRLGPDGLAEVILTTTRSAQAELAGRMQAVVQNVYGAGSETATFISNAYAEQFPVPDVETESETRR